MNAKRVREQERGRGKRGGYYHSSVHRSKCCEMRAYVRVVLLRCARARVGADSGSSLRPCTIVVDNTLWYSRVLRSPGDPSDLCTQVFLRTLASLARSGGPCPYPPFPLLSLSVSRCVQQVGGRAEREEGKGSEDRGVRKGVVNRDESLIILDEEELDEGYCTREVIVLAS